MDCQIKFLLGELDTKQDELTKQLVKVHGYIAEISSLSNLKNQKDCGNLDVARKRDHDFMNANI